MRGLALRLGASALLLLAILVGCTPPPPQPSPSPTSASPSETEQERQERVAYQESETALRAFRTLLANCLNQGGAKSTPPSLAEVADGPILKAASTTLRQAYELGGRTVGRATIVTVK